MTMTHRAIHHAKIAVSYYCNLRCQHCYVPELNRVEYKSLLEDKQMSLQSITDFVDLLHRDHDLQKITVTGGEALLNIVWPRTKHVMKHALGLGLEVWLNTSGSGQIPMSELASLAKDSQGKIVLQVSLDGIDEQKVDLFRGKSGSMKSALKTIIDAVKYGIYTQVRYTATEDNMKDVEECYKKVMEMGADMFIVKPMFPSGVARDHADKLIDSRTAIKGMQERLIRLSEGSPARLRLPQPVYASMSMISERTNTELSQCNCGGSVVYLSTDGDIYPCTYLLGAPGSQNYVMGNLRDPSFNFQQAWSEPGLYAQFRNDEKQGNCTAQNILNLSLPVTEGEIHPVCT